jgi:hypothetical protein
MPVRTSPHPDSPGVRARRQVPVISKLENFLKLASTLLVLRDMSVLRTMSLIVGAALVAVGGSAIALFL